MIAAECAREARKAERVKERMDKRVALYFMRLLLDPSIYHALPHYGTKLGHFETSNHSPSHELRSERSERCERTKEGVAQYFSLHFWLFGLKVSKD